MGTPTTSSFTTLTVSTTAVGFPAAAIDGLPFRSSAYCTVENGSIRYRTDGTDPTSTVGHLVASGGSFTITSAPDLKNFRAIRSGVTDATVSVTFFVE